MTDAAPTATGTEPAMTPVPAQRGLSPIVIAAIIVTVVAWASAFVVIRGLGSTFGGGELALLRLAVGTLALSALVIGRPWVAPTAREWGLIAVVGVAWFGVYNIALNLAEQSLDAGTTALVVNVGPLLIALGAGILLGEGLPRWLLFGAAVAFGGVVLIAVSAGLTGFEHGVGMLLALAAAVTYAIAVLAQKPVLRRIPARQVTFLGAAIGTACCLPFAPGLVAELATAPASDIAGGIYLGVVPTALAFSTWAFALARVPAGQLAVTTYIVPALVVLMAFLAFGEVPAPLAILGGVVALGGVALSRRRA